MNIRLANVNDAIVLTAMGRDFIQYSEYRNIQVTDEELQDGIAQVIAFECSFIAEDNGKVIGAILGVTGPLWFAPKIRTAIELAWWVDPAYRITSAGIRLLKTFEDHARNLDMQYVAMSDLVVDGNAPVARLLARMGYSVTERMHTKEI
jgi:RimJ/RimL family protein N-acetyltransferase